MSDIAVNNLSLRQINKSFGKSHVLHDINIDIAGGEFVCFLGPSGCGKTTLLRIIAGLEAPDSGALYLGEENITHLHAGKRNFGVVFQSYALFPNMTAGQNIAYGLKNRAIPKNEIESLVNKSLEAVGLLTSKDLYPSELSGGQQQRIALARVMVLSPRLLLLDEPLSALDGKVRTKLRSDIKALQEQLGVTTIMVTHDQEEALTMADRIIVLEGGQVIHAGTPKEIYDHPVNVFVAELMGTINILKQGEQIEAIRPEHIDIYREQQADSIAAHIKHIEYRGSMYRLRLNVPSLDVDVDVDVSTKTAQQLFAKDNNALFVHFDAKHILTYLQS